MRKVFRSIVVICLVICFLATGIDVLASDETTDINDSFFESEELESYRENLNNTLEEMQEESQSNKDELGGVLRVEKEEFRSGEKSVIHGQALLAISFTPEEAELYKAALNDTLKEAQEDLKKEVYECEDEDRADFFKYQLEELQKVDIDEMFVECADGSIELKIPHKNAEIIIDGTEYRTDKEGYYSVEDETKIENLLEGEMEVVFADENVEFASVEISFDEKLENNEVKFEKTFLEFAEGIANMSERMQNAEGQTVQVFYAKKKKDDFFGAGSGRSQVYKDVNIVGCNKHDKNLNSINDVQFALQNSDCAKSVRLGIVQEPSQATVYPYSAFCVEEAFNMIADQNLYCNGKDKMRNGTSKNGHINCSWFKGIGHSESFHTHADKGTAPTTSVTG